MKTIKTMKQTLFVLAIALSIVSCKKNNEVIPVSAITITDLKALSTGASVKVPDGKKISGIVISDISAKNVDSKTVVLQEAADKPGIIINFDAAQTFMLGDQLEVNISNQTLAQVNGEVILSNIPAANAKKTGTGTIAAKAVTVAALLTDKTLLNGTLVQLPAGTFSGGNGQFTGTLSYTDASGTIKSTVLAGAAFENTDYAPGIDGITGIVRINGSDIRVDLRNASDVTTSIKYILTEEFKDAVITKNDYDNINGFTTSNGQYTAVNFTLNYFLPLAKDDFLDKNRKYLYLTQPYFRQSFNTGTVNLKGLKNISLTFAGSNYTGDLDVVTNIGTLKVLPFDAAKHKVGVNIYAVGDNYGPFPLATFESNAIGQFNTVNFKFPSTVDEFVALLVNTKDPNWAGLSATDAKPIAEDFMAHIKIGIANYSTNRVTNMNPDPGDGYPAMADSAPVIIEKINFGFAVKP
jgi:hypothetical protein